MSTVEYLAAFGVLVEVLVAPVIIYKLSIRWLKKYRGGKSVTELVREYTL